jgi:hypothetical protein
MSATSCSGNGNGNGNGHTPKFGIVPVQDENLASIAPQLRYSVQTNSEITDGAKVLYCFLSDQSFLKSVSPARGVVMMSKLKLAQHLKVSIRSVSRHARQLEGKRFLWTRIFWRGGFELTNWYLRGLADAQAEMWDDGDPSWGKTKLRGKRSRQILRGSNGQFCPHGDRQAETADLLEKTVVHGQPCPVPTVKIVRCQRTAVTVDNGQPCPLSTDSRDRGQRTAVTVDNGQPCPLSTDNSDRGQRTAVSVLKETPSVKGAREGSLLNVQRGNALKKRASENDFLADVREIMNRWRPGFGALELEGSGANWRKWFRETPDKARRVLADITAGIKEGRQFTKNPGAAAVDLYRRLP